MHICQDEIIAAAAALTSIPFVRVAWFRLRARLSGKKCADRPACDGHAHAEPEAPAGGATAER